MQRKTAKARTREYIIVALLLLAIVWLVFLIIGIFRKEEIARHASKETQGQVQTLKEREGALQGSIDELNTERGQEATLRETYGVARPGEEVIIVVPPKEVAPAPELSWWQKVFGWFGIWR